MITRLEWSAFALAPNSHVFGCSVRLLDALPGGGRREASKPASHASMLGVGRRRQRWCHCTCN
jgi:hypothetical protein